jgi:hypothetical protein
VINLARHEITRPGDRLQFGAGPLTAPYAMRAEQDRFLASGRTLKTLEY